MNSIKEDHPDEYDIFVKELEEELQLKQIIQDKIKLEEKIQRQEKYCKKLRDEADKIEVDISDNLKKQNVKIDK